MISLWEQLLASSLAGGVVSLAFFVMALPTKWGEKYLTFHFDRKLAAFKDSHAQQIEQLRDRLNHLADRGKRSNEKEFEALNEVWVTYVKA